MSVTFRRLFLVLIPTVASLLFGCASYENLDGDRTKAMLVVDGAKINDPDGLDVEKGDPTDWKIIRPGGDGVGALKVIIGDPFKFSQSSRHGIAEGRIQVLDPAANLLAEAGIVSGKAEYVLEFPVKKGGKRFVSFVASKGKDSYTVEFKVLACNDCADNEVCKDGQCVELIKPPRSTGCASDCRRGYFCLRGHGKRPARCVKAKGSGNLCGEECARIYDVTRKYLKINYGDNKAAFQKRLEALQQQRSTGQNRCTKRCQSGYYSLACLSELSNVKKIPSCKVPCGGECKRGSTCNEDTDTCEKKSSRKCKSCRGVDCPDGKRCRCGRCVNIRKPPTPDGPKDPPPVSACSPPCSSRYRCDAATKTCKPKLGPIACRIIQVTPSGGSSSLKLSRGRAHFVAQGDKGSVPGIGTFVVTKVFARTAQGRIKAPHTALQGKTKCSINRKNYK